MSLANEVRELQYLGLLNSSAEQKQYALRYNKAVKRGAIKPPTYRLDSITSASRQSLNITGRQCQPPKLGLSFIK